MIVSFTQVVTDSWTECARLAAVKSQTFTIFYKKNIVNVYCFSFNLPKLFYPNPLTLHPLSYAFGTPRSRCRVPLHPRALHAHNTVYSDYCVTLNSALTLLSEGSATLSPPRTTQQGTR